jgi:hypothetical protein
LAICEHLRASVILWQIPFEPLHMLGKVHVYIIYIYSNRLSIKLTAYNSPICAAELSLLAQFFERKHIQLPTSSMWPMSA